MLTLTPKEIENAGANRYIREQGRLAKATVILIITVVVGMVWMTVMDGRIADGIRRPVAFALVLGGLVYYFKLFYIDALKAGKKFREEWDKEHV